MSDVAGAQLIEPLMMELFFFRQQVRIVMQAHRVVQAQSQQRMDHCAREHPNPNGTK